MRTRIGRSSAAAAAWAALAFLAGLAGGQSTQPAPTAQPAPTTQPAPATQPAGGPQSIDEEYRRRTAALDPADIEGHLALAAWARGKRRFDLVSVLCKYVLSLRPDHVNARLLLAEAAQALNPASAPAGAAPRRPRERLSAPQMLSDRDINRLKFYELRIDGPPEPMQVRFLRRQGDATVEELVRQDILRKGEPLDAGWSAVLERGRNDEKLRLTVRETGAKYADRIDIRSNPKVFEDFRRHVLPLVNRGCARGGCHTGPDAEAFRLPSGARQSDRYLFTTFLLLAEGDPPGGPLINRSIPEESTLLTYMLPASETRRPHPPLPAGRMSPAIRSRAERNYQLVLDWISSLRVPRPTYELDYVYPPWLSRGPRAGELMIGEDEPEPEP